MEGVPFRWAFGCFRESAGTKAPRPGGFAIGHVLADRFRITGTLGRGGMSTVLSADDLSLDRPVAVKLLRKSLGDRERERFVREGELTASLAHPGVVRVHGGGVTEAGHPFMVMEAVEGARELEEVLAEASQADALDLLEEVARAIGYAHGQGVIPPRPQAAGMSWSTRQVARASAISVWAGEKASSR